VSLLDQTLPDARGRARIEQACATPAPEVFGALARLTGGELAAALGPLLRGGLRLGGIGDLERPLYAQLLAAGLVVLASDPLREVVIGGYLGRRGVVSVPEFIARDRFHPRRAHARVGAAVALADQRLSVELRVDLAGPVAGALRPLLRPAALALLSALTVELG
jgi:hypothetical protein